MKYLFIFTPYNWDYCGGALAVIASTYDEAVDLLLEIPGYRENGRLFLREHFSEKPESFPHEASNQWLLTSVLSLDSEYHDESKVVLVNFNYS